MLGMRIDGLRKWEREGRLILLGIPVVSNSAKPWGRPRNFRPTLITLATRSSYGLKSAIRCLSPVVRVVVMNFSTISA